MKYVVDINRRSLREDEFSNRSIRYIDIASVGRGVLSAEPREMAFGDAPSRARRLVEVGDTIVSTVRTYLRAVWPVIGDTSDLVVSTGFAVLTPKADVDARFLGWWAQSDPFVEEIVARSVGVSYPAISGLELGDVSVPVPPLEEQRAFADYLDTETFRIDSLIERKRRLAQLVTERMERRLEVVGLPYLDNDGRKSPLDVPRSEEVPDNWEIAPIGSLVRFITYGFTNPMPSVDDGPFMLTANDIGDGVVLFETARRTTDEAFRNALTDKSRPRRYDVLITKDGSLGRVAMFDGETACINQSVALLRPRPERISPQLFAALLRIPLYRDALIFNAGGTTIKHLYITRIAKQRLAFPAGVSSQEALLNELSSIRLDAQVVVDSLVRQIELLTEHRRALITAAFTGKLDIPGVAA